LSQNFLCIFFRWNSVAKFFVYFFSLKFIAEFLCNFLHGFFYWLLRFCQ
jgi:hypothetical protein